MSALWRANPRIANFIDTVVTREGDVAKQVTESLLFGPDDGPNSIGAFSIAGTGSAEFQSQALIGPSPGVLPSLWFKRDDVLRVILVEIDYVEQTGSGTGAATVTRTKYLADHQYFDEENGRTYRGCITSLPRFNRAIDRRTLRGRFTSSIGSVEIDNQDGEYDDLLAIACDASEVRFYIGDGGDPISARQPWLRSEFAFVFSALAVKISSPSFGRISVALRDTSLLLEKTVGGNVAIGGTGVNADKFRPKNFGLVHNITCPLKDFATLTYVYNEIGGALVTLLAVRCRGDSIAYVDNGDGTFNLLANPAGGLVTADVLVQRGGVSVPMLDVQFTDTDGTFRLSDAFQQIVGTDAGLSALGKYAGPSPNFELNWSNDYHVGINIPEARDLTEVVDELCATGNVYCATRRDGMFTFGWMRPEALDFAGPHVGAVAATIRNDDLVKATEPKIEHADPSEAFYSVQGYGNVNWTPQTDLALGLDESVAETYRRKGFYADPQDGTDPTGSYIVPASAYNGPWDTPGYNSFQLGHPELYHKALRRSKDNRTLISCVLDTEAYVHLRRWESVNRTQRLPNLEFVDVPVDLSFCNLEIGNVVELDVTEQDSAVRFGFSGKKHQVVSIDIALTERIVRLGLVRRRPAIVDVYYLATAVTIQAVGAAVGGANAAAIGSESLGWNPLDLSGDVALSNGGFTAEVTLGDAAGQVRATQSHSTSGKWYFEVVVNSIVSSAPFIGIRPNNALGGNGPFDGGGDYGTFIRSPNDGHHDYVPGSAGPAIGPTVSIGDVFMYAVDLDNGKFWRGREGTWDSGGNPATNTGGVAIGSGPWYPWASLGTGVGVTGHFYTANMEHTIPSGFSAWS